MISSREWAYRETARLADLYAKRRDRAARLSSGRPADPCAAEAEAWEKARKEVQALANRFLRSLP